MADNVNITPGTGAIVAADDIGGALHQRVKISQGADGSATDVSSAAPLQVTLANTGANTNKILTTPDLPSGAATAAKQPALGTAGTSSADVITVQGRAAMTPLLTDGSATTQPISGSVTANIGTVGTLATAAKQDTVIGHLDGVEGILTTIDGDTGNISTKIDTIAGAVSGSEVQVDVLTSALPTGAATSAKQDTGNTSLGTIDTSTAASSTSLAIIDDWDESDRAKVNPIVGQAGVQGGSGAVSALTQRVSVATDDVVATTATALVTGSSTMNATSSDGGTALTSTAQVIKASAGRLLGYYIFNPNTITQFVQFYNTAAASVTVGTTNPLFMLSIPAGQAANLWAGEDGPNFSNAGWSWAATATAGGNGAPTTALDAVAFYK